MSGVLRDAKQLDIEQKSICYGAPILKKEYGKQIVEMDCPPSLQATKLSNTQDMEIRILERA